MSYTRGDPQNIETHDVKIEDVKPLEKHINVTFKIVERTEEREINTRSGDTNRVCDFTVADETGSIILTLWNEDIDFIEDEEIFKLSNGFANIFQNSIRLSKGKFGELSKEESSMENLNTENNRSAEHIEDPRRRSFDNRSSYGGSRGYGSNRSSGGYGNRDQGRRRSSGRSNRW
ncbi:hypothetical protein [Candidatus Hodarchaeum mangrovi]